MAPGNEEKVVDIRNEDIFQITVDDKGRYVFPSFTMYVDEENTEEIKLVVQKTLNLANYNTALYAYINSSDPRAFGQATFKNMIVYPKKAQNISFWDNDPEALAVVVNAIIEIMGKKKKELKRNLNFNL